MNIPFLDLRPAYEELRGELDAAYRRVMESGWYVLDLGDLDTRTAERRFTTDFADRLYRRKGQPGMDFPLHLFVDEADMFVPQEKEGD